MGLLTAQNLVETRSRYPEPKKPFSLSYDDISDTIDIIKEDYNIELISTDIIGIVNEFDTMKTLAKKYGTKEDVIYHVKALYR